MLEIVSSKEEGCYLRPAKFWFTDLVQPFFLFYTEKLLEVLIKFLMKYTYYFQHDNT